MNDVCDDKMGNVVTASATVDDFEAAAVKPQNTLFTIRAAGAFKAKLNKAKDKSAAEQIGDIIEQKFRRKNTVIGSQPGTQYVDDQQREVLKFIQSVNVSVDKHGKLLSINDTSVAWNALRESANRDRIASLSLEHPRENNRLKKITDAVRFIKRSAVEPRLLKNQDEVLSYDDDTFIPQWETQCHICRNSSTNNSSLNPCRICPRTYHTDCLSRRGYLSGSIQRETVELSKTEIGWSCFNCENLFELLTDTEKIDIMETFDRMDTNQDSVINREEYLDYQEACYRKLLGMEMPEYRITAEKRIFADMDRSNTGVIDWWEYLIPMSVRKLTERKKINLVSYLTKQEVYKLRDFFKAYDQEGYGEISKHLSRVAFKNWYLTLINLKHDQVPLWDWLGTETVRDQSDPEPMGLPLFQRSTTVTFKDFVKNHALYILAARPNTGSMRPYVPRMESYGTEFDDEEDADEYCY